MRVVAVQVSELRTSTITSTASLLSGLQRYQASNMLRKHPKLSGTAKHDTEAYIASYKEAAEKSAQQVLPCCHFTSIQHPVKSRAFQ
jgi:hypothetical protein